MATYASNPTLALPEYTPEVNLGIYAAGLQQKTQQYYEGIQKVQGYIDNIAGLELSRPVDKEHLGNLMADLQTKISNTVGNDFSSLSVVNSVAGLAGSIYRDPQIKNGVASTANLKALEAAQKELKEKHPDRYSIENEHWDNKRKMKYLNDTDPNASFSNSSPTPYIDINKTFLELFKQINSDSELTQGALNLPIDEAVQISSNGTIQVLNEKLVEGIGIDKIRNVLNLVKSRGDVQQQLIVSSDYMYQNVDRGTVMEALASSVNTNIKSLQDYLAAEENKISLDNSLNKEAQAKYLSQIREQISDQIATYKGYLTDLETLSEEQLKKTLYQSDWEAGILGAFTHKKTQNKIVNSPIFEAKMKRLNYDLALLKENRESGFDVSGGNSITFEAPVDLTQLPVRSEASFRENIQRTEAEYNNLLNSNVTDFAARSSIPAPKVIDEQTGQWKWNTMDYSSPEEAQRVEQQLYSQMYEAYSKGNAPTYITNFFNQANEVKKKLDLMKYQDNKIQSTPEFRQAEAALQRLIPGNNELGEFTTTDQNNNRVTKSITKDDMIDYYFQQFHPDTEQGKAAAQRLEYKFGPVALRKPVPRSEIFGQPTVGTYFQGTPFETQLGFGSLGSGLAWTPELFNIFKQLKERIDENPDLITFAQKKEDLYKRAQSQYAQNITEFTPTKVEHQRALVSQVAPLLRSTIVQEERFGVKKSQAQTALELLGGGGKGEDKVNYDNLSIGYSYDPNRDQAYIYVIPKGQNISSENLIPVSKNTLTKIPGVKIEDSFEMQFGSALNLTEGRSTDVTNGKEESAYDIARTPGNPYQTKYHLFKSGDGYNIRLWVRDTRITNTGKDENLILDDFVYELPSGASMRPEEVLSIIQLLSDPKRIQTQIDNQRLKNGS